MTELTSKIATGLNALVRDYECRSNNIANSHTAGYKRRTTSFSTELEKTLNANFNPLTGEIQAAESVDFAQGQLLQTGRPLDVALEGKGFLTLDTPSGRLYTRNGSLQVNILGQLTDLNGHRVTGANGPITIPNTVSEADIVINDKGVIRAQGAEIGQLQISEFDKPSEQLEPAGNGCFRGPRDFRPGEPKDTMVRQGYREGSNVQLMDELSGLLSLSRAFEANMNVLKRQRENSTAMLEVAKS